MREIDTDALLGVAPFLKIGNPATATRQVVFDDENLQQVLDVTPLVARASGFVTEVSVSLDPALSTTSRSSLELRTILPLGPLAQAEDRLGAGSESDLDAYLVRCMVLAAEADAGNLDEVQLGYRYIEPPDTHNPITLFRSDAVGADTPILSTVARRQLSPLSARTSFPTLPIFLTWDSELLSLATASAGGSLETFFLFYVWICRKGVPLNFAV